MRKIAFTICSNNYLAQAKVLIDSIKEYSPEYEVFLVLCDKRHSQVHYECIEATIIEASEIGIDNFDWMISHYNIVELNTALKPFAFKYLISRGGDLVYYFDPDIRTYCSLEAIEKELDGYNIMLTPHSFAPLSIDGGIPDETTFTNYGIYNLGFCAVRSSEETQKMLNWWCGLLKYNCWSITTLGLFVDQLPMNLVPLYFGGVKVCKHRGMNVSWWNLHERKIVKDDTSVYKMDSGDELCFFHFSNYSLKTPNEYTGRGRYSRSRLSDNPVTAELYSQYYDAMVMANDAVNAHVECAYIWQSKKDIVRKYLKKIMTYGMFKFSDWYKKI